jgi:hypothetical protein
MWKIGSDAFGVIFISKKIVLHHPFFDEFYENGISSVFGIFLSLNIKENGS